MNTATAAHASPAAASRSMLTRAAAAERAFFSPDTRPVLLTWYREEASSLLCHLAHGGEITGEECRRRTHAMSSHTPPQGWAY